MATSVRATANFSEEQALAARGIVRMAGVDEAGRGPLAGPVTAAAVIFPIDWMAGGFPESLRGLNDSKQLTARQRNDFFEILSNHPGIERAIATVDAATIDRLNILAATHEAMNQVLGQFNPPPEHVLVDGLEVKSLRWPQTALVKGDSRSLSIAAASVLAKVTRDRLMLEYHVQFPEYGFAAHKGYGTAAHLEALRRHGPCPIHRQSFAPVRMEQGELFPS